MKPLAGARSFLFVPGDRPDRIAKALASASDRVIVDFEDAVALEAKERAREGLLSTWDGLSAQSRSRILVRINAAATPWQAGDVELVAKLQQSGLGGVVVPKSENAKDLQAIADRATGLALVPLIESAEGLGALEAITRAPGVCRLAFGHLDFQVDLGMQAGPDEEELLPVRLAVVVASRRAGLAAPIDGVTVDLKNEARLEQDCARSRRLGFTGKLCIHPAQVDVIARSFAPSEKDVLWARRVLDAAAAQDSGAFSFEGGMVDAPVLARARRLLED